ncbi:MAG: NAD(P)-dependent oxidoreductase [Parcubacteria group bacterium]|jgi:phosphoglycerate dehydrogenase-like enzyme
MKPKGIITCAGIFPEKYLDEVRQMSDLAELACSLNSKEFEEKIKEAEFYIQGGEEKNTLEVMQKAEKLKKIFFAGINYESFYEPAALEFLKKKGVHVYPTGGGQSSVARLTYDQIMLFARTKIAREGVWPEDHATGLEKSPVVRIIGAGGIGAAVLKMLAGKTKDLGYVEVRGEVKELRELGVKYIPDLEKAFDADIVSLHVPYIPGVTDNLITKAMLSKLRPGAVLINNARAEIVDREGFLRFQKERPDVINLWDVLWWEGDDFRKLDAKTRQEIFQNNFFFNGHKAFMAYPELTKEEYGQGLMKLIREHGLV